MMNEEQAIENIGQDEQTDDSLWYWRIDQALEVIPVSRASMIAVAKKCGALVRFGGGKTLLVDVNKLKRNAFVKVSSGTEKNG